jgi:hypothetical protein
LHCLWDLQALFFNLYTCASGSQVTGTLGVSPPTISEYPYSFKRNLFIDLPRDVDGEEFDADVADDFYI